MKLVSELMDGFFGPWVPGEGLGDEDNADMCCCYRSEAVGCGDEKAEFTYETDNGRFLFAPGPTCSSPSVWESLS